MKNALQYYYDLNPKSLHQVNNDYRCSIGENEYVFRKVDSDGIQIRAIEELSSFLLSKRFMCHQIIANTNGNVVTEIDGNNYILLKIFTIDRLMNENDLYSFANQYIDKYKYSSLDHSDWYNLWTNKIDYIEYQVSQLGRDYPLIRLSINYYIGLAETAISLISNLQNNNTHLNVSHRRIKYNSKIRDFYDPLHFVLDSRVRDLSEFFKEKFFYDNIELENTKKTIASYKLNSSEAILFFSRMIFPSYYFDCYQSVVLGEIEEIEIKRYIKKIEKYQNFLKDLYFYLRQYYNIPEVEWILKT